MRRVIGVRCDLVGDESPSEIRITVKGSGMAVPRKYLKFLDNYEESTYVLISGIYLNYGRSNVFISAGNSVCTMGVKKRDLVYEACS